MKSLYLDLLWKTILSIVCVASLGTVAILGRLETAPEEKIYPIVLFFAVVYLHWITWELFFGFFGVPPSAQNKIKADLVRIRSISGFFIAAGHVVVALSVFNHLVSPEYAHAAEMITWALKLIAVGVLIQMLFSVRELLSERFRNEK
jgi:hypothetical protein